MTTIAQQAQKENKTIPTAPTHLIEVVELNGLEIKYDRRFRSFFLKGGLDTFGVYRTYELESMTAEMLQQDIDDEFDNHRPMSIVALRQPRRRSPITGRFLGGC